MRFLTQNATTTATIRWLDAARTRWGPYNAPPQILYLDLTVGLPGNGGNRDKREVKEGMRSSNVSKVK